MMEFLAQLTPEPSLYTAYFLFSTWDALWIFLWLSLGGLAAAMLSKKPEKE